MARSDSFQKKWASAPSQFERPADALIDRGWAGGAAEDPPEAKWENWWHNRVDEALAEIEQNGALTWFEDVPYGIGATARSGGKNWIAAIASAGIEPDGVDDLGHWQELSLEIASKAEAETSDETVANNTKRMTPLRVLQAIKARLINATETVAGMLRVGTQDEVNAGALDDVAVTPKKLRFGFSLVGTSAVGAIRFPDWFGKLQFAWGGTSGASGESVTFALGFSSPPRLVNMNVYLSVSPGTAYATGYTSLTSTGFVSVSNGVSCSFISIGIGV